MSSDKNRISFISVLIICTAILYCHFKNPRLEYKYYTDELSFDIFSYYMFLPFTFIYDDVGMTKRDTVLAIFDRYHLPGNYYQAYALDNGNWTPNYTCGFALLWLPFFLIGHFWAMAGGYLTDGWSFPYQFSLATGAMIYVLAGLFFLRKVLLRFFDDRISALVLLLITFGTNYFHEAYDGYMGPHPAMFTGYAMLLYFNMLWHDTLKRKYAFWGGLVMGFMILCRPSEIVCIFIPLFWNVWDRESFRKKIQLIRNHFSHILILLGAAFIPFIPQIIYWKVVTGSYIFYSYQHTEGFDFLKPHIINVLFSFKKSWFVYTPIIIFPIIGIYFLKKYRKEIFLPVLIFFLVNFYLLASWAAWWNGGSYGMRYFIESYAVMTLPFGYLLSDLRKRKWYVKTACWAIMSFFVFLNLFQSWQYAYWIIPDNQMTFEYYKRIFLKKTVSEEDKKFMEVSRHYRPVEILENENEYVHRTAAYFNFENINSAIFNESKRDTSYFISPPYSYKMTGTDEWGPGFQIRYDQLVPENKDHVWLRVSINYLSEGDIKENETHLVITMPHGKYQLKYSASNFADKPHKDGEWNTYSFDYMTPFPYHESDHFDIYIWHRGNKNIWLDNFQIEAYHKRDL